MAFRIIGAGLGRTGTMSMKLALEQLGMGRCYHMAELIADFSRLPLWLRAAEGAPDWEAVFAGFTATVDYPGCTYWRELAAFYPDAKVLLTVRDPDDWFDSTQATIFRLMPTGPGAEEPFPRMLGKVVCELFDYRMHDRDHCISVFNAHNRQVREVIAPERLLVYEVAQGWAPLCDFLGVPVPAEPMPKVNSTQEFQARVAAGAGPPRN